MCVRHTNGAGEGTDSGVEESADCYVCIWTQRFVSRLDWKGKSAVKTSLQCEATIHFHVKRVKTVFVFV